jgi:hypothetical protein
MGKTILYECDFFRIRTDSNYSEMDKQLILNKIGNIESPIRVNDKFRLIGQEALQKAGLAPRLFGLTFSINNVNFREYVSDETLMKELEIIAKLEIEHDNKIKEMKAKVNEEFKKLERAILLEGAGVVAEMLVDVVKNLLAEVEDGI